MKKYQRYLHTNYWKNLRAKYLETPLIKKCIICGNPNFELHHLSYKNLGKESSSDLVPVCRGCHQNIHNIYKDFSKKQANNKCEKINITKIWNKYKNIYKKYGMSKTEVKKLHNNGCVIDNYKIVENYPGIYF